MLWQGLKDSFHLAFGFWRSVYAIWRMSYLPSYRVTVFGGTHVAIDKVLYKEAYQLGALLAVNNMGVITGGGPGIMEATLCGAQSVGKKNDTIGISVENLDPEYIPLCYTRNMVVTDFAMRKRLLINYSSAFVQFPGGIGTLDELSDVMNLIVAGKMKRVPIILVNTNYWKPLLHWFNQALNSGFIEPQFHDLLICIDDVTTIPAILLKK